MRYGDGPKAPVAADGRTVTRGGTASLVTVTRLPSCGNQFWCGSGGECTRAPTEKIASVTALSRLCTLRPPEVQPYPSAVSVVLNTAEVWLL